MTTLSRVPTPEVVIDWSNDGDFGDTNETVTTDVLANPPASVAIGSDQLRERTPPMIGTASFELNNRAQTYSAEFPGSPIYGLMLPGRAIEIRQTYGGAVEYDAGDTYDSSDVATDQVMLYDGADQRTVYTGVIDEPKQQPDQQQRSVGISCFGNLSKLRGQRISTQLYESITTGTAIGYVLDAAGWPAGDRDIDTGQTTLLYWWAADTDAYQALVDLLTTEGAGAKLHEDGDGILHFEDRNHRSTATRSTVSQATFYDEQANGLRHLSPMSYTPGFRDVVNACQVEAQRRSVAATAVIWTYGIAATISAGASTTFVAKLTNPAKSILCVNTTDVTVSAGSITGVALNRTSGQIIEITLTAGGGGATLSLLQLRGDSASVAATYQLQNTVDTSASQAEYGVRSLTLDSLPDIDPNAAQDLADAIVNRYQEPLAQIEFTLKNVDAAHLYRQLYLRVSDRVTLVEQHTGIDNDFWIERIAHSFQHGGNLVVTTFGASKCSLAADDIYFYDDAAAVYDTAKFGS